MFINENYVNITHVSSNKKQNFTTKINKFRQLLKKQRLFDFAEYKRNY